jgi:tetratricopeptide (TPR) repeat protein
MNFRVLAFLAASTVLLAQQSSVEGAWALLAKGNRAEAVALLRNIITVNPRDGEARLMLGSILVEDGKGAEGIGYLNEAVQLMPRSAMAHNALGEAFNGSGDAKGARAEFEKATALDPKFGQAYVNLGAVLAQAGESAVAAGHLDRGIRLLGRVPDAAYPLYLRAKIYTEQDKPEQAAAALKEAVALQADFAEAWSDLGQARKVLLDDEGAFAAFQRSVELNPENSISQYRLGAEYLRQGKAHEAVVHLRESLRLNPANQSTLYSLQLALRQDGKLEEAKLVKEKLTELLRQIDKESQDAFTALKLNNEGAALEKNGNLREASKRYMTASRLDPKHVGFRVNLAVALLRLGDWKGGIAELREALRQNPGDAKVKAALEDALAQAPAGAVR